MSEPHEILEQACAAATELLIAAPYVKAAALRRVLNILDQEAQLTCITRWTAPDVQMGVSDLECRQMVLDHGGAFLLHPSLHAKYYRCDARVLVGSANLTHRGMGTSATPNLEILCEPGPTFDAQMFEADLIRGARPVGDEEFRQWESIRELALPLQDGVPSRSEISTPWTPATRDPENVWRAYNGRYDQIRSADERRLARSDLSQLEAPVGLDRAGFDRWVCAQLLASPDVDLVGRTAKLEEHLAWECLAVVWDVRLGAAARSRETIINWVVALGVTAAHLVDVSELAERTTPPADDMG